MKLPETLQRETGRVTWLAIGERAGRTLASQVGEEGHVLKVGGLHAALGRAEYRAFKGCLAEAAFFEARPEAGLDVLIQHLSGAPLWLLAPPITPEVEDAARRREVPVLRTGGVTPASAACPSPDLAPSLEAFLAGCSRHQGDVDELTGWILRAFAQASGADRASLLLGRRREGGLEVARALGPDAPPAGMTPRILVAPGIATEAAARGRPRVGYASSPRYRGRAYAVIPFVAPDGPVGAICLTDLPADEIPRRDRLDTWSEWARHAGAFLRTALDLRGARESALTDPKTALPNARAFQAALTREHERVRRSGGAYGVAVFDIDRFKAVNTELTHPIADRVLVAVAGELKASFREADLVSRWGGEEFAVLLTDPDAPEGEAGDRLLHAVDRARGRVEDHPTRLEGREDPYRVTVSAGLAVYPEDAAGPDSLVEGAFAALGAAKHAGRNRVHRRRAR